MKDKIIKTVLAALVIFAVMLMSVSLPVNTVDASSTSHSPQFKLSVDKDSVKQGEYVTVTLSVTNSTEIPITAFKGTITFNTRYCEYLSYILESDMGNTIMCGDSSAYIKDNTVSFLFNDPSAKVIPGDGTEKRVFSVSFSVPKSAPVGTSYFSASVEGCYGNEDGDHTFAVGVIPQANVTVKAAPTTTTTTKTTTTTTTTTTTATTTTTTQAKSSDANLAELIISPGDLSPRFSPDNIAYTVTVPYEVTVIRIVATASYYRANIYGTGAEPLNVGNNVFTVMVIAEDGTVKQYGIIVQRQQQVIQEQVSQTDTVVIPIATPTDITTLPTTEPTEMTIATSPTDNGELDALLGTMTEDEPEDDGTVKIIGIAFAILALFFFGFLSGYYIDKANKRRAEEARAMMREMSYGGYGQRNDMQNNSAVYGEGMYDGQYNNQYDNQYAGNYTQNVDYQNGMNYNQNSYTEQQPYEDYDSGIY